MNIEERTLIDAGADRVWEIVGDPTSLTRLAAGLSVHAHDEKQRPGEHVRYRVYMDVGPVPVGSDVQITEFTPARELAWTGLTGTDQRFRLRLRAGDGDDTRLVVRFGYNSPGPVGIVADAVAYGAVRNILRRLLAAIKAEAEQRAV